MARTEGGRSGGSINRGKGLSGGKKIRITGGSNGAKPAPSGRTGASRTERESAKRGSSGGKQVGTSTKTRTRSTTAPSSGSSGNPKGKKAPSRSVTVQKGDTLWDIANKSNKGGSNASKVAKTNALYRANKGTVGSDPNKIKPGQKIKTSTTNRKIY